MRQHRRLMVMIVLIAVAAVVLGSILVPLLSGGGKAEVDLTYSSNPQDVIVQVEGGGGPPPIWEDYMPAYRLFSDGTVIMQDPNTNKGLMVQGKISSGQVADLLQKIRDDGFFDLNAEYNNKDIYDGGYTIITVQLTGGQQQVFVRMMDVPVFTKTLATILNYPVADAKDFVPAQGYLAVMTYPGGSTATLGPESPAYAALPDLTALAASAANSTPVPIDGAAFVTLKKLESEQQYLGFRVQTDTGDLVVYPVYVPRSVMQSASQSGTSGSSN